MAPPDRELGLHDEPGIAAELEQLRRLEPPAERDERRQQILHSVLAQAALQRAPTQLQRRAPMFAIAALAAAALCALWIRTERRADDARQIAAAGQRMAPSLQLTSGKLEAAGEPLRAGARIAPSSALRTDVEPAQLVLADTSVLRVAPSTTLVYAGVAADREERVQLQHGRVSLQVNGRARRNPLVVETAELSAWVVGTRFDVIREEQAGRTGTTVRVSEGVVRVVAKADARVRLLAAGQQLTVHALGAAQPQAQREPESEPPAAEPKPAAATPAANARSEAREQAGLSVEIRRQLRQGAVGVARRLIQRAERERAVSAVELSLLQAEADLAERRYGRAKSRYLAIVTEHAGSPEAELSLFAAAQLSRGREGVDLLQRYLARYPDGRFAKEAHRLLQALDLPADER
jgi:ferric-dicitrate binding protein FerR (iron transport regulator)